MRYGPMNALADILGAYWKKERIEGALNAAANYGKQINDMGQQKYIQNPVQPELIAIIFLLDIPAIMRLLIIAQHSIRWPLSRK